MCLFKFECDFYSKNYLNIGSTHAPVIFFSRLLFGGEINEKNKGNLKPVNRYRRTGGEAQYLFGLSINFRGGERALLRYGLESTRVYLPGMAPGIGAEASAAYGAYLDSVASTSTINLNHMGGFLSTSKEMGYTYGVMQADNSTDETSFSTGYLRQWRFKDNDEWGIAVEVLRPL